MPLWRALMCILTACVLAACQTAAQPAASAPVLAALQGGYFRFNSHALARPLHIYVALPENYAAETRAYPAVYLTDGDSLFPMLAPTQLFLTYDEPVPPVIMIGIAYGLFDPNAGNMRHVDFRAAGAPAFQRMLAEELIPEIERRYRADPARRVLVGQSRGASFVLMSAFNQPDLFWGRIASNASFSERDAMYGEPATGTRDDLRLFVASGSRDRADLRSGALEWNAHWNTRAKPWALRFATIENGTHAASMGEAYRQGMLWLFAPR